MLLGAMNYINMDQVLPIDETLQTNYKALFRTTIDLDKSVTKLMELEQ